MAKYVKDTFTLQLVDYLADIGEEAIMEAYYTREYTNRTFNLHDSYASAVYVNGLLYKDTIRYISQNELAKGESIETTNYYGGRLYGYSNPDRKGNRHIRGDAIYTSGRDEAISFFKNYKARSKGIELVVIAAMFYTGILESGVGLKRKYQVISNANTILKKYAKEMGASVEPIHWDKKFHKESQT